MKKGQGLPLNTIVIAIIVIVVLVAVIVFFTGGFGKIFAGTKGFESATQTDVVGIQTKCSQLCIQAQSISDPKKWNSTAYCKQVNAKDWEGDGKIDSGIKPAGAGPCKESNGDYKCCWEFPISTSCSASIGGQSLSESECNK